MIQNLIFVIIFLKIVFWTNYFLFSFTRSSGHHQFFSRFSSRKSQSQQNLAKKIIHFTIQLRSKNISHFTNLNSLDIENNMLPKTFFTLQISQQKCFYLVSEKVLVLHHFLTPKNCILEATFWRFSYFSVF